MQHLKKCNYIISKASVRIKYNLSCKQRRNKESEDKYQIWGTSTKHTKIKCIIQWSLFDEKLKLKDIHQEKGASIWLLMLPLKEEAYCLTKQQF